MGRLAKLFKGFWSLFVRQIERANPQALLEAEIVGFHETVGNFNKNLAKQAGLVERLREQVKREEKNQELLTARITANYKTGNLADAGKVALQAKNLQGELEENRAQLQEAEDLYQNLTRQREVFVKEAQRKIETIKHKLSRAEMAEAQAHLAEMATSTSFDLTGSGATLERIEEDLDVRISEAKGKARVSMDAAAGGTWVVKEAEQSALEQQALSDFASTMGLSPPATAETNQTPSVRDLGGSEDEIPEVVSEKTLG